MNCKELHVYWETDPYAAISLRQDSVALAEHVSRCSDCNRFVEEQKELAKCLRLVRDSAATTSASVDSSVLARYRDYLSERSHSSMPVPLTRQIHLREALGFGLALAFAVVVAYGAMHLLIPPRRNWVDRKAAARQPMVAPQTPAIADKQSAVAQKSISAQPKSIVASTKHRKRPTALAEQDSSVPIKFQSLMYCDPISCPGTMDIIRVQLPSPVFGMMPGSAPANGFVAADVLVGPDGVARGIRLVE
jgi:hypothetical protein